ncbi:putative endonuclease [Pseudomonas phage MR14]|nr:putative endonuclease [Pseudomonas phage MR14]
MPHLYRIECLANGKSYIGATTGTIVARYAQHLRSARKGVDNLLYRALRKYGTDQFQLHHLAEVESDHEVFELEVQAIALLGTFGPGGYNMTPGGEGVVDLTEASKQVRIMKAVLQHAEPEFKARHLAGVLRSQTPEKAAATSRAHKGKKMHPNAALAIAAAKKLPENRATAARVSTETWQRPGYRDRWLESKECKHVETAARFPYCEDLGLCFASSRVAALHMRAFGFPKAANNNITQACNGKYKSCCGYRWRWMLRAEVESLNIEVLRAHA